MRFRHSSETMAGCRHAGGEVFIGNSCQDAVAKHISDDLIVLVAADGCGGGSENDGESQSELAALNTSLIVAQSVKEVHHMLNQSGAWFWDCVQANALRRLQTVMGMLHGQPELWMSPDAWKANVLDRWLCTVVCAYITPTLTQVVSMGDGIYSINGDTKVIDQKNRPMYLAKALLASPEKVRFTQHAEISTDELETLLIGTDGVTELHEKSNQFYPGTGTPVGPISQLWTREEFFTDPASLQRWLQGINTRRHNTGNLAPGQAQIQEGLLSDDIGFHTLRR